MSYIITLFQWAVKLVRCVTIKTAPEIHYLNELKHVLHSMKFLIGLSKGNYAYSLSECVCVFDPSWNEMGFLN